MSLLLRVDANAEAGFGHLSRCLNLARHARQARPGVAVAFAGDLGPFARRLIDHYGIPRRAAPPIRGPGDVLADVGEEGDAVVVDAYGVARSDLEAISRAGRTAVHVSDFRPEVADGADVVIDFTVGAEALPYRSPTRFLGPGAYLAKPEFAAVRERNLRREPGPVRDVLVLLGGARVPPAVAEAVLRGLDGAVSGARVTLVAPEDAGLGPATLRRNALQIVAPTPDIERLYAAADLVVAGGGLPKYEAAYCAVPCVSVARTPMQRDDSLRLEARGLARELAGPGGSLDRVAEGLRAFLADDAARGAQVERSAALFRTDSGARVAQGVLQHAK